MIIVEDGSTDASAAVIDTFAKNDQRFTVISTAGIGAGAARNRGMQEVSAPYFMLLDGDDVFHPTMIESLYRAAADGTADIAICDMQEMDDATGAFTHPLWALKQSQLPPTAAFDGWRAMGGNLFAAFMGWPWDKLYRTEFVRGAGLTFPEDLANSEDMLFTYQALVLAKRLAVVNEVLIDHRMGRGGTVSSSREKAPIAFYDAICRMKTFLQKQPDDTWIKLQLDSRPASFFTLYPRSMVRYAVLMTWLDADTRDDGPLGNLKRLPYGKHKFWDFMNPVEKALTVWRKNHPKPSEW